MSTNDEITKELILSNLRKLDELYLNSSSDEIEPILYSKLALIEYCGWLECSIDIIMNKIVDYVQNNDLRKIGKSAIKKVAGFSYDNHFIILLIQTFGIVNTDKFYQEFQEGGKLDILRSKLNNVDLITARNKAAHTYHSDSNNSYNAPNLYVSDVEKIHEIFVDIYNYINCVLSCETPASESSENLSA